ncbi:MAG: hypothetical protein HY900_12520 [Deltaproteobacteria bacterium]|nr:hypothetical protein [Deltaproteobacteria bacterium]
MNSDSRGGTGRAERIRAFRDELAQLELDRVLILTDEQRWRLRRYHEGILRPLLLEPIGSVQAPPPRRAPPAPPRPRLLPWAVTGALWAAVLITSAWAWDLLPLAGQLSTLSLAPFVLGGATHLAVRSASGRAWVSPLGLSACAALLTAVLVSSASLGAAPGAALAAALGAALLCAYACDDAFIAAGAASAAAFASAWCLQPAATSWTAPLERPETLFPAGAALLLLAAVPHRSRPSFPPAFRLVGLAFLLVPMALLCNWGAVSVFPVPPDELQTLYRAIGGTTAALTTVVGLWRGWRATSYAGVSFLAVFLYSALVSWWWHRIPDYAFFSGAAVLALTASAVTARMHRARTAA